MQTVTIGERVTDIRLNMNKNGSGTWEVSLCLVRVASNDSHMIPGNIVGFPINRFVKLLSSNRTMVNLEKDIAD
ncbi:YheC/YheD family protein, partial [Acinetobacter baumannii]